MKVQKEKNICMSSQLLKCAHSSSAGQNCHFRKAKFKLKCLKFKWLSLPTGHRNRIFDRSKHQAYINISIKVNLLKHHYQQKVTKILTNSCIGLEVLSNYALHTLFFMISLHHLPDISSNIHLEYEGFIACPPSHLWTLQCAISIHSHLHNPVL